MWSQSGAAVTLHKLAMLRRGSLCCSGCTCIFAASSSVPPWRHHTQATFTFTDMLLQVVGSNTRVVDVKERDPCAGVPTSGEFLATEQCSCGNLMCGPGHYCLLLPVSQLLQTLLVVHLVCDLIMSPAGTGNFEGGQTGSGYSGSGYSGSGATAQRGVGNTAGQAINDSVSGPVSSVDQGGSRGTGTHTTTGHTGVQQSNTAAQGPVGPSGAH